MSIAHETRIAELEQRVADLTEKLTRMSGIERMAHLARLEARVEALEQRSKPGPKPKGSQ
jgi:BMFP domain-containing protein YqiC